VVLAPFITWGVWGVLLSLEWFDDGRLASLLWLAGACATFAGASCIVSGAIAIPAAAVLRGIRRRRLGSRLAAIAPAARAELLCELERDRLGDTRKIAASLRREF